MAYEDDALQKFEELMIERHDPAKKTTPSDKFAAALARDLQIMLARKHQEGHDKWGVDSCSLVNVVVVNQLLSAAASIGSLLVEKGITTSEELCEFLTLEIALQNKTVTMEEAKERSKGLLTRATARFMRSRG